MKESIWAGDTGSQWAMNNYKENDELNFFYEEQCDESLRSIWHYFMQQTDIDRESKILEVGCGPGNNLRLLDEIGFKYLYGIDINPKAVYIAQSANTNVLIGDILDVPFKNGFFDMVYCHAVLMHIDYPDLYRAISELIRATNKWLLFFEPYTTERINRPYKDNPNSIHTDDYLRVICREMGRGVVIAQKDFHKKDENEIYKMFLINKEGI